jgi:hypothetical protein
VPKTSTSRQSFLQWPIAPKFQRKPEVVSTAFHLNEPFPNSTYRDMFREVKVPLNKPCALGLQAVALLGVDEVVRRPVALACTRRRHMCQRLDRHLLQQRHVRSMLLAPLVRWHARG